MRPNQVQPDTVASRLAAAAPPGWERYYNHLKEQEDRTHTAHAWIPTDVVNHYREYDRDPNDPNYQTVKKIVSEDGIRVPLWISVNDTHGLLVEGNNRLQAAKELGIQQLPVRLTRNNPVLSNEGNPPVPHHPAVQQLLEGMQQ
jgi:endo-1,4-beta-D-glucanase Y